MACQKHDWVPYPYTKDDIGKWFQTFAEGGAPVQAPPEQEERPQDSSDPLIDADNYKAMHSMEQPAYWPEDERMKAFWRDSCEAMRAGSLGADPKLEARCFHTNQSKAAPKDIQALQPISPY